MTDITDRHLGQSNLIEGVKEPHEVLQSRLAWNLLREAPVLTDTLILNVHNLVMMHFLPGRMGGRGSYRITNVEVGGRSCPHWRVVPDMVDSWLAKMQHWQELLPKQMHIEFEHIHPFIDGNGRTGRLLMWWHEIRLGQEPTVIEYADRFSYYDWFNEDRWNTHSAKP